MVGELVAVGAGDAFDEPMESESPEVVGHPARGQ